jgi:hypothetical protein
VCSAGSSPSVGFEFGDECADRGRVELPLTFLDALVERLDVVVAVHRYRLLGEYRAGVDLQCGQVHGAPRDGDTGGQGVLHGVPPRKGGQQGRMGVEDAAGIGVVHRLRQHGAESRHGHDLDAMARQRLDDSIGVADAVEVGPEAPEVATIDENARNAGRLGDVEGPTGTVRQHHRHRDVVGQQSLEDAPGARDEDTDAHRRHATSAPVKLGRDGQPGRSARTVNRVS